MSSHLHRAVSGLLIVLFGVESIHAQDHGATEPPAPIESAGQLPPGSCVLPLPPLELLVPSPSVQWLLPWSPRQSLLDGIDPALVIQLYEDVRDLVLLDVPVGGVGDDVTFQLLVEQFLAETDAKGLCRLAHRLHVQATRRHGTIWTIAGEPYARLHQAMTSDPWPLRRAFALVALSKESGSAWQRLIVDTDPLVRAAAARWLKPPSGTTESEAGRVVAVLFELARSDHAPTRAVAVRAVGPWIHDEARNAELVAIAETDVEVAVRLAALEGLLAVRSLSARAIARKLARDPEVDPALASAAAAALASTGIALDPFDSPR